MLFLIAILLIALFFVAFFSNQLMGEFGDSFKESITGKVTYTTIERNMKEAALKYLDKYYENEIGAGTLTILSDSLIQYNLLQDTDFVTSEKDICKGYVLVKRDNDNSLITNAFIKCENYKSMDYQDWRIGDMHE